MGAEVGSGALEVMGSFGAVGVRDARGMACAAKSVETARDAAPSPVSPMALGKISGPVLLMSSSGAPPPRESQPITNRSPRWAALRAAGRTETKSSSAELARAGTGIVVIRYHGPASRSLRPDDSLTMRAYQAAGHSAT